MCGQHARQRTDDLAQHIQGSFAAAQMAFNDFNHRHQRIKVRARNRSKGCDECVKCRARGDGIGQQRNGHVAACEALTHDAGAHHCREQHCGTQRLGNEALG